MEALEKENSKPYKQFHEMKIEPKMGFGKVNDIDEDYFDKFIDTFEELKIEEMKISNRLLVEKVRSVEKKVSLLSIKETNRYPNQVSQSDIENKGEYATSDDTNTMQSNKMTRQQKYVIMKTLISSSESSAVLVS